MSAVVPPVCPSCTTEAHTCPGGVLLEDGTWVLCTCTDCCDLGDAETARTIRRRFSLERGTRTHIDPTRDDVADEE